MVKTCISQLELMKAHPESPQELYEVKYLCNGLPFPNLGYPGACSYVCIGMTWVCLLDLRHFISFPFHPDTFLFLLNSSASLKRDKSSSKSCTEGCSGCLQQHWQISTSNEGGRKGDLVRQETKSDKEPLTA